MKRVVRSFGLKKSKLTSGITVYDDFVSGSTHTRQFKTEVSHGEHEIMGLDSEVTLGKSDLEKLGYPQRIKVVIYSLDD